MCFEELFTNVLSNLFLTLFDWRNTNSWDCPLPADEGIERVDTATNSGTKSTYDINRRINSEKKIPLADVLRTHRSTWKPIPANWIPNAAKSLAKRDLPQRYTGVEPSDTTVDYPVERVGCGPEEVENHLTHFPPPTHCPWGDMPLIFASGIMMVVTYARESKS